MTGVAQNGRVAPVVLIHGATSSSAVWDSVLARIDDRWPVFTPTLAGHRGGSALPRGEGGVVARIVDDLCAQLDDLGVDRAHLVGNSLGGWVALELARRQRARSVLAFSPAGAWRSERDLRRLLGRFRGAALMARFHRSGDLLAKPGLRRILL
jgi:pimeloyl-ACP methyl ester carboxylesterase